MPTIPLLAGLASEDKQDALLALFPGALDLSRLAVRDQPLADQVVFGTIAALNGTVTITPRAGDNVFAVEVGSTAFVGTLNWQYLTNVGGGSNWRALNMGRTDAANFAGSSTAVSVTFTAPIPPGCQGLRVTMSAYTSGTADMALTTTAKKVAPSQQVNAIVGNATSPAADGSTSLGVSSGQFVYNNSSWDKQRGVTPAVILASAARTTAQTGADRTNWNYRGLLLQLDVTAVPGSGGLTLSVEGKTSTGAKYVSLLTDSTPITAIGTYIFEIAADAAPSAASASYVGETSVRGSSRRKLPRVYRVNVAVASAASYTYSLDEVALL